MAITKRRTTGWLSLFLFLFLPFASVLGQADPESNAAKKELTLLQETLLRERFQESFERIAANAEKSKPHLAKALRKRAKNLTKSFMQQHAGSENIKEVTLKLLKPDIQAGRVAKSDVSVPPDVYRAFKDAWVIREVRSSLQPEARNSFKPPAKKGYLPEVASLDPAAPHTLHDLNGYVSDRLTRAVIERAVKTGAPVELHAGGTEEMLTSLKNRNMRVIGGVNSPLGNYEQAFLVEGPDGKIRYTITGISGADRARHLQSLLRLAKTADGKTIPSNQVSLHGDFDYVRERNVERFRDGLERLGFEGDKVIIGFKKELGRALTERGTAAKAAGVLQESLGADPYKKLLKKIRAERDAASGQKKTKLSTLVEHLEAKTDLKETLSRSPSEIFRRSTHLDAFQSAERYLAGKAKSFPSETLKGLFEGKSFRMPEGYDAKKMTLSRSLSNGHLKMDEYLVRTKSGKIEPLKVISNYYGDTMGDLGRALVKQGVRDVYYLGTAGGVRRSGAEVKVGDVHIPSQIYDQKETRANPKVKNGLIDALERAEGFDKLKRRTRTGTKLGNVFSPAVETEAWLERMRTKKMDAVEVENSYLARAVEEHNKTAAANKKARLHTAVIISDVPGSEATLSNMNASKRKATFDRLVDLYLESQGIQEVFFREKGRDTYLPQGQNQAAHEVAEKLIGKKTDKLNLMRENVARFVKDNLSATKLEELAGRSGKLKPEDLAGLSGAKKDRLAKMLDARFDDRKLVREIGRANARLGKVATDLAASTNKKFDLLVTDAFARGRFTPNSELVISLDKGNATLETRLRELVEAANAEGKGPKLRVVKKSELSKAQKTDALHLNRGEAFARDANLLKSLYRDVLFKRNGIVLGETVYGNPTVSFTPDRNGTSAKDAVLFSRYRTVDVGPNATRSMLRRFREKVARRGGRVVEVTGADRRLPEGSQARTIVDKNGRAVVLVRTDIPLKKAPLIDELTHVLQIDQVRKKAGPEGVRELFRRAEKGDPLARQTLLQWEVKAKRNVLMTLRPDDPARSVIRNEITRLEAELDPFQRFRRSNGRINWTKTRRFLKQHGAGAASFTLALFLKELGHALKTGDRLVIEEFFDGLMTTDFWANYGLFVAGSTGADMIYSSVLAKRVKPAFVNGVLRSTLVLAAGMALPQALFGHFDGRVFVVDVGSLLLSSTAVKAGLRGIHWVYNLKRASRTATWARRAMTTLKLGSVPGWIYGAVELAVVLTISEEISRPINRWLDDRAARKALGEKVEAFLKRIDRGGDPEEAIRELDVAFHDYRTYLLKPAIVEKQRLMARLAKISQRLDTYDDKLKMLEEYPHLAAYRERLRDKAEQEARDDMAVAFEAYFNATEQVLESVQNGGRREEAYVPDGSAVVRAIRGTGSESGNIVDRIRRGWNDDRALGTLDDFGKNRPQTFDDQIRILETAGHLARNEETKQLLERHIEWVREARDRDAELLGPDMRDTDGIIERLKNSR